MKSPLYTLCLSFFAVSSVISVNNLREEFTWTRIDYDWGNNRRTREVALEERYGYSLNQRTTKRPPQQEELYFPDTAPGYNSGSGFRPGGTNGRKPTLRPYNHQNQNYGNGQQNGNGNRGQQNGGGNRGQSQSGGMSNSQSRENYIFRE